MKFRIIEWHQDLYIVVGIGYNDMYDPPDVFYVVPIDQTLLRSVITNLEYIQVPFYEAIEITDEARIKAIWVLYGR